MNLLSEDRDKSLFSKECKEAFTITGKCTQDLFEGRAYKIFQPILGSIELLTRVTAPALIVLAGGDEG